MSVEQYEALVRSAERREAVAEALASVRAEGLEPPGRPGSDHDAEDRTALHATAQGPAHHPTGRGGTRAATNPTT